MHTILSLEEMGAVLQKMDAEYLEAMYYYADDEGHLWGDLTVKLKNGNETSAPESLDDIEMYLENDTITRLYPDGSMVVVGQCYLPEPDFKIEYDPKYKE